MRKNKNKLVRDREFVSTGRIRNLSTHFYLRFVKKAVDELNSRTIGNVNLARKSFIVYGLIPAEDGTWKLEQLTSELMTIAQSNMAFFMVKILIPESNIK